MDWFVNLTAFIGAFTGSLVGYTVSNWRTRRAIKRQLQALNLELNRVREER